jgi:hypothetical protein
MTIGNTASSSQKRLEKLVLPAFLISTIFMVTSASKAINYWSWPWNQVSIFFACILPTLLVILVNSKDWFKKQIGTLEVKLILIIIALGILNIVFGEAPSKNFKGMGLFLVSGISIFAATKFILRSQRSQTYLFWLYTIVLAGLSSYSIYAQLSIGFYTATFANNPIPESAIITLLLSGPILLLNRQKTLRGRGILILCILIGIAAIIILRQRAAIFSVLVTISLIGFLYIKKFWAYFLCVMLIMTISLKVAYISFDKLPENTQGILVDLKNLPVERMEMYFFAYHLIKKAPFTGTGLWAPLTHHLSDYKEVFALNDERILFRQVVERENTSFHNFLLCMFVQMGSSFALIYLGLLAYLFVNLSKTYKKSHHIRTNSKLFTILLAGFFIQSMSVDSLMYPDINFLFHSLLGVIINFKKTDLRYISTSSYDASKTI